MTGNSIIPVTFLTTEEVAKEVALGIRRGLLQQCSDCLSIVSFSPDYDRLGLPPAERPSAYGWYCAGCGHFTAESSPCSSEYRMRTARIGRRSGGRL